MNPLSDDYLLVAAQISATLIGLLFVGIYYFLETGLGRLEYTREQVEPFIRSMSKLILLLFSLALGIAVGLVALSPIWMRFLFIALGIYLLIAAIRFAVQGWGLRKTFGRRFPWGYLVSAGVWIVLILSLPWILGGWTPERTHYGWALLLSGLFAFMQTGALLLESFDIHQQEEAAKTKHLQLDEETGTPSKEKKWTKARRLGLEERLGTAFQNGPPIRISQGGSSIEASIQLRPTISETGRAFIHTAITPLLVTSASNPFDTCLILVYDIAKRAVRVAPRLTYIDIRLWQELPDGGGELLLIAAFDVDKVKALIDQTEWTAADVRRVLDHQMVSPVLLGFGQAATE
jgi:hypothetical protein